MQEHSPCSGSVDYALRDQSRKNPIRGRAVVLYITNRQENFGVGLLCHLARPATPLDGDLYLHRAFYATTYSEW
jgi:hypothetical protein